MTIPRPSTQREAAVWGAGAAWLALVVGGFWFWERYELTPGAASHPTAPDERGTGRWELTVFAHPRCPCSRATLRDLAQIVADSPDLTIRVLFVRPEGAADGWERSESWDTAGSIPGARVTCDADGVEARRLGAETSGAAVLTDPDGRVVFRGGLTTARGRTGPSAGRQAVRAWVSGGEGAAKAPVFGCPLFDPKN